MHYMKKVNILLKGLILLFLCLKVQAQKVDFVLKQYAINNPIGLPSAFDINGDGELDMVQTHFKTDPRDTSNTHGLYLSYNLGNFNYSPKVKFGDEYIDYFLLDVIDINHDGMRDLILRKTWDSLGIAIQVDSLHFMLMKISAYYPNPYNLKFADMDNNGRLDMVFMQSAGRGNLKIVYQIDSLVFVDKYSLYDTLKINKQYDIGDFNRDGKMDLVYFENGFSTSVMHIHIQRDSGIYNESVNYLFSNKYSVRNICVADINQDGRQDIAAICNSDFSQNMAYRLQDTAGLFTSKTQFLKVNDTLPAEYVYMTIKKLNCTQKSQMVWLDKTAKRMSIYEYADSGQWIFNNSISNPDLLISDPLLKMDDYDRDGKLDFLEFKREANYKTIPVSFFVTLNLISNHTLPTSYSIVYDSIRYDSIPDAYSDGLKKVNKLWEYVSSDTVCIRNYVIADGVMMDHYTIYKKYYYVEYVNWTCIQDTIYQVKGTFCGDSIQDTIVKRTMNVIKKYSVRDTTKPHISLEKKYNLPTVFGSDIVKVNQSSSINLYPNPTSAEINIEGLKVGVNPVFRLYDLVGKNYEIAESRLDNSFKLNVSNLPSGIYFLQIIQGAQIQSKRVEIVK